MLTASRFDLLGLACLRINILSSHFGQDGVTCLTWIGTSRYLATGCVDGRVRMWDSLSGECVRTFTGHSDAIQSLAVSANNEYLVSVALDNTARIFEIAEYH